MTLTVIDRAPLGAALAVPGPSDTDAAAPIFELRRLNASELVWSAYASLLHPADAEDVSIYAYQEGDRTLRTGAKGAEVVATVRVYKPRFVTLNAFRETVPGWARKKNLTYTTAPISAEWNLATLNSVWVELDFYKKPRWRHLAPELMVHFVLERCEERGLPQPSLIVCSGRGLYLLWLHDRLPAYGKHGALSVWKALQKAINDNFIDMGRDIAAMSATTNLRVAGSKNTFTVDGVKVSETVRIVWPTFADQIERYSFSRLKAECFTYTADEVKAFRAAKAEERAARKAVREAKRAAAVAAGEPPKARSFKLTRATFQRAVMADLERLFDDIFDGRPVPEGQRDIWLYHLTTAAAWLLDPAALREEVKRLAPRCGLAPRRALTLMGSVLRNANRAAKGQTRTHKGRAGCDYRYRTNPRRMVEELGVTVEKAERLDLRVLVPRALKSTRMAQRAEAYRRSRGAESRRDQQAERLAYGQYALERRAAGASVDELAFEARAKYGPKKGSKSWVEKAMREARAVALGTPKAKPGRPRKAPVETVAVAPEKKPYGSSRSMTGLDKDVPAVVACEAPAYDGDVHSVHLTMTDTTPAEVAETAAGVSVWRDVPDELFLGQFKQSLVDGLWREYRVSHWAVVDTAMVEGFASVLGLRPEETPGSLAWFKTL